MAGVPPSPGSILNHCPEHPIALHDVVGHERVEQRDRAPKEIVIGYECAVNTRASQSGARRIAISRNHSP
jgi:hypothetical protein